MKLKVYNDIHMDKMCRGGNNYMLYLSDRNYNFYNWISIHEEANISIGIPIQWYLQAECSYQFIKDQKDLGSRYSLYHQV